MSQVSLSDVQCETVQYELDTQFQICNPICDMPALQAILATQRAMGITQTVSGDNGKVKTVKVTYDQRALESAASDTCGDRVCTSENRTYNNYTTYDIDPSCHITYGEYFKVSELATVCQDFQAYLAKKIAKVIDVIERKAASKVANALVALYGKWGDSAETSYTVNGSDELVVGTFISAATKAIDYTAMTTIDNALALTGYCQPPIIVGGSVLWAYGQHIQAGCCQSTGVNVMEVANQFGKAIMYDKRIVTALGSDLKSIVFQPGAVALIFYNEYDETKTVCGTNYCKMKVFSPCTGMPIDIVMKDDCGTISIIGYLSTELVGLPADMFAVGDEYRGVNYVNKILVTNPA